MQVSSILSAKGSRVLTVTPATAVPEAARILMDERVGALVVLDEAGALEGIISERDIAHGLARHGARLLELAVAELMSRPVETCTPEDRVDDIMRQMTEQRVRHLPVVAEGALVGIVSIGDVVKRRVDDLEAEREQLRSYIAQS